MPRYEYKVIPAPHRGEKVKGVRTPEARFAHAVQTVMNEIAADGWEYLRSEMLPSTERSGLTGSKTAWRNLLVFRRIAVTDAFRPERLPAPQPDPGQTATEIARAGSDPNPGASDREDTRERTAVRASRSPLVAKRNAAKSGG